MCIPPVSLPRAAAHCFRATADAEPPEEPPGILRISQGLLVTPKAEFSVVLPMPNSSRFVFPSIMPPSACTLHGNIGCLGWLAGNTLQSQGCTNLDSRDYQRIVWRSMHLWSYHNKKIGCSTSKASRAVLAVARSLDNLFTGDEAGRYLKQS